MTVAAWLEALPDPVPIPGSELHALRAELDAAAAAALGAVPAPLAAALPLRLPKRRLVDLERCERSAVAHHREPAGAPGGIAALRGRALDQFVAHQLVAGRVREPVADLHSMLHTDGDWDSLELLDELDVAVAEAELAPLAAAVADAWSGIDPVWSPRTQSRATLSLADGAVRCDGIVDVELGGAGTTRPGVLIEVKSGSAASAHPHEAYLYGLLVALRDGVAPAVVARWYPGADPVGLPVTLGVLESAAARLTAGTTRWAELLGGAAPVERGGGWCAWCPDRDVCPSAVDGGGDDVD